MSSSSVKACLNILRRTPPQDNEKNIAGLMTLLGDDEEAKEEFLQRVDVPLKTVEDPNTKDKKKFIICDYNHCGDSHRSPWTNNYYPPLKDGTGDDEHPNGGGWKPSPNLRALESHANEVLDSYRELYYGKDQSASSVYLWKTSGGISSSSSSDVDKFSGCFLIEKEITSMNDSSVHSGFWNSIHVIDVNSLKNDGKAFYKLYTTIHVSMLPRLLEEKDTNDSQSTNICGTLTRQVEKLCPIKSEACHIVNIGKMLEDMESEMRSNIDALYIQKTKEVLDCIYTKESRRVMGNNPQMPLHALLNQAMLEKLKKSSA